MFLAASRSARSPHSPTRLFRAGLGSWLPLVGVGRPEGPLSGLYALVRRFLSRVSGAAAPICPRCVHSRLRSVYRGIPASSRKYLPMLLTHIGSWWCSEWVYPMSVSSKYIAVQVHLSLAENVASHRCGTSYAASSSFLIRTVS